jgi:hypothetical protein
MTTSEMESILERAANMAIALEGELADKQSKRSACEQMASNLVDMLMEQISALDKQAATS